MALKLYTDLYKYWLEICNYKAATVCHIAVTVNIVHIVRSLTNISFNNSETRDSV